MAFVMHADVLMKPFRRETVIDRRQPFLRWSPIFGGAIFAIGLWTLLQVLGMGVGLAAIDTDDAGSLESAGIATGIWSIIAPLIAMFVGGLLAGRTSGTRDRKVGAMHGSVMWALALGVGLWAMMSLLSSVVGGVSHVAGAAGSATSSLVDTSDLTGVVNERLKAEGKPPVTTEQLDKTMRSLARRGISGGRMDRQTIVDEVARNTSLSRADSEQIATDIESKYEMSSVGEDAKHMALTAADKTGKALMLGGLMMLLSLGAALGGGALGVPRVREEDFPVITTTPEPLD